MDAMYFLFYIGSDKRASTTHSLIRSPSQQSHKCNMAGVLTSVFRWKTPAQNSSVRERQSKDLRAPAQSAFPEWD